MGEEKVILLFRTPAGASLLKTLSVSVSPSLACDTIEDPASLAAHTPPDVLVVDTLLADFPSLAPYLTPRTAVLVTGRDEISARRAIDGWPAAYYVDFAPFPTDQTTRERYLRELRLALDRARLKAEVENLTSQKASRDRVNEVYSEIREIKSFISDNVVKELEKRVALQVRYLWFQGRKQKIEGLLRKIYVANDVSSLLDIGQRHQGPDAGRAASRSTSSTRTRPWASSSSPWSGTTLSSPTTNSRSTSRSSTRPDFAAQAVRAPRRSQRRRSSTATGALAPATSSTCGHPLRSLLAAPILHETDVIGVLEVYNKHHDGAIRPEAGFTREDQQDPARAVASTSPSP